MVIVFTTSVDTISSTVLGSSCSIGNCPIEGSYPKVNSSPSLTVSKIFLSTTSIEPLPL
jgi:hypothetical protein